MKLILSYLTLSYLKSQHPVEFKGVWVFHSDDGPYESVRKVLSHVELFQTQVKAVSSSSGPYV